jgi:hypothetical protein
MSDPTLILEMNREALAQLRARERELRETEDRLDREVADTREARAAVQDEIEALEVAGTVYRRMYGQAEPQPADSLDPASQSADSVSQAPAAVPIKARVGEQRYRILVALRGAAEPLTLKQMAEITGYPPKRVKDQMKSDAHKNVVTEMWDKYRLTAVGVDLLERFEAYKLARGEPLPALRGPPVGDGEEDDEAAQPSEGGAGANELDYGPR